MVEAELGAVDLTVNYAGVAINRSVDELAEAENWHPHWTSAQAMLIVAECAAPFRL
jgi:hypothetical protein